MDSDKSFFIKMGLLTLLWVLGMVAISVFIPMYF